MTRKQWLIVGLGFLVLLLTIHPGFFFNPVLFHKDDVTYLPWSEYRSPLRVEYIDTSVTPNRYNLSDDNSEVTYVFKQLKMGLGDAGAAKAQPGGKTYTVDIRTGGDDAGKGGPQVLVLKGVIDNNVGTLTTDHGDITVKITDSMMKNIKARLEIASPLVVNPGN